MKPSLRQLEYLVAIAETGTFSAAAKRCYVSQPSLSTQIKDMEDHLGITLLERGRQGAMVTPVGEEIVRRARLILREIEELKVLAQEADGRLAGHVRLGVLPTIGPYLLPRATRQLHTTYPELRLSVREEATQDLQTHLQDGRFDIILSTLDDHPGMESLLMIQENIYICVPPDDSLAVSRGPIALSELKDRELLTLGHNQKFSNLVERLASTAGAVTSEEYHGTSLDAIRQMASMGTGIAVLPSLYAISEAKRDSQLIVRRIDHPLAKRQISLNWRPSSPLSEKFQKIGEVFRQVACHLMSQSEQVEAPQFKRRD